MKKRFFEIISKISFFMKVSILRIFKNYRDLMRRDEKERLNYLLYRSFKTYSKNIS
jgi:hypothetical protein